MPQIIFLLAFILAASVASIAEAGGKRLDSIVVLDGTRMGVRWSDGDSFKFRAGEHKGRGVRLLGFNTLESYGPVHRWGEWTAQELYALAESSSRIAASREWACHWDGKTDGYKRMLVECPELSKEMVRQGHAMVFEVERKPDPALLALQRDAQARKVGMWAKGVPRRIVTSAHSAAEEKGYERVVDTRTGVARAVPHTRFYETCQEVCVGSGRDASCLVYVPFESRYRDKAWCLKKRAHPPAEDRKEPPGKPAAEGVAP